EQAERHSLVDEEQHTVRHRREKKTEGDQKERQFRRFEAAQTQADEEGEPARGARRQSGDVRSKDAALPGGGGLRSSREAPTEGDGRVDALASRTDAAGGAKRAEGAESTGRSQMREEIARLADKIVERAQIGRDEGGRRIMMLDLHVPDRGNVSVRLRQRGDGFEVRMRADNEDLARELRREREHFRQSASDNGVDFTSIEIA
ncbi:MAG: flagellar hook-length control protein FliK, partial [Persicimonas sp.]